MVRIALVATTGFTVPPPRYGGINRIVATLADGLVERGHDVTLFAAGGSTTRARLRAVPPQPVSSMPENARTTYSDYQRMQAEAVAAAAAEFDVIHSHVDYLLPLAARQLPAPLLTTMHNPLDTEKARRQLAGLPEVLAVALCRDQRDAAKDLPNVQWVGVVYPGLDSGHYPMGAGAGDERGPYFLFLGRVEPQREPVTAIRVALRAGVRLKIAGRVFPSDREYWTNEVEPLLLRHPDQLEWVGEQDDVGKRDLLRSARALLMPSQVRETFGLVFVEALACGTPVIACPRGSLPEIVRSGVHGSLSDDLDELADACRRLVDSPSLIDRAECRHRAVTTFTAGAMVERQLEVYERVVARV